jgi:hypothetical protein
LPNLAGPPAALLTLALVIAVQLSVGTLGGSESTIRLDRPYYQDYWYYAGLARAVLEDFPPRNPAFAGSILTQYNFHLAPLSLLSQAMSPYLAMRLLNVIYAVALVLLLRRYDPSRYGVLTLCVLFTAPPLYENNPLSMDLLTRGFHHLPFFLLLLVALFEQKRRGVRAGALFLLPWLHGLMAAAVAPVVLFLGWRDDRRLILFFALGFALAAAGVLAVSEEQPGGALLRSLSFQPAEALRHLVPLAIAFAFRREPALIVMAASGFALSTFVTWNRFYFLFPLDFALALAAGRALSSGTRGVRGATAIAVAVAFVLFLHGIFGQFAPHRPFDRRPVAEALDWIESHTPRDAVFLVAPTPYEFLQDDSYYRTQGFGYWLLENRNLYVGFYGWSEALGLPGVERSGRADAFLRGQAGAPPEASHVFYGPMERAMYPEFRPPAGEKIYEDASVMIWRIG